MFLSDLINTERGGKSLSADITLYIVILPCIITSWKNLIVELIVLVSTRYLYEQGGCHDRHRNHDHDHDVDDDHVYDDNTSSL